ncbi:MAG: hypothetical protein AB2A00_27000 [Myxococcota bacterium]
MVSVLPSFKRPSTLVQLLQRARAWLYPPSRDDDEGLLGPEQLARCARALAYHHLSTAPAGWWRRAFLPRHRAEAHDLLSQTLAMLERVVSSGMEVPPAAQLLLRNAPVLLQHLERLGPDLRALQRRSLPLAEGRPRIWELSRKLVAHTEADLRDDVITLFVSEYQRHCTLTHAELRALPTTLRLGLLHHAVRTAGQLRRHVEQALLAHAWATRLGDRGRANPRDLTELTSDPPPLTPAFVTTLRARLREQPEGRTVAFFVDKWLQESGVDVDAMATKCREAPGVHALALGNVLSSLDRLATTDWDAFLEQHHVTDRWLRRDPTQLLAHLTSETREQYRAAVAEISRDAPCAQEQVAQAAVELAQRAWRADGDPRRGHVGYYLVDEGRTELEAHVGCRPAFALRVARAAQRRPHLAHLGGTAVVGGMLGAGMFLALDPGDVGRTALALLLAATPVVTLAFRLVDRMALRVLSRRSVPVVDFRGTALPESCRTVVVLPARFTSVDDVRRAATQAEDLFIANRDARLQVVILSGFPDAQTQALPGDGDILLAATRAVEERNTRHGGSAFLLLHRSRRWDELHGVWRGDQGTEPGPTLDVALHGVDAGAFSTVFGNTAPLRQARYAVMLDETARVPPEGLKLLIGAMAHPLNRPILDATGRVVRGHGVLQPRRVRRPDDDDVTNGDLHRSAELLRNLRGHSALEHVGIYDIAAFRHLLPQLRAANATEAGRLLRVDTFDKLSIDGEDTTPQRFRGLLRPWLLATADLSWLLLLLCGWTVFDAPGWAWSLVVTLGSALPWLAHSATHDVNRPKDVALGFLRHLMHLPRRALGTLLSAAFTAPATWMASGAWCTAWGSLVAGLVLMQAALWSSLGVENADILALLLSAAPFVMMWLGASSTTATTSQPTTTPHLLSSAERHRARRYALMHWHHLDQLSRAHVHGLVPDVVMEDPPRAGNTTSARTLAMQLLAVASARDLGLIGVVEMVERLEQLLGTMSRLPRYRGHFHAEYDLRTLRVVAPPRISTEQSGQLAAALLALHQACVGVTDTPLVDERWWEALEIPLSLAVDDMRRLALSPRLAGLAQRRAMIEASRFVSAARTVVADGEATAHPLAALDDVAEKLRVANQALLSSGFEGRLRDEAFRWLHWAHEQVERRREELRALGWRDDAPISSLRDACRVEGIASSLRDRLHTLAGHARHLALRMDFQLLYDEHRKLLATGWERSASRMTEARHERLAATARMASFLAVAKGDVPLEHWTALSRAQSVTLEGAALLADDDPAADHLQPFLLMKPFAGSLLERSCRVVLAREAAAAAVHRMPWGRAACRGRDGTWVRPWEPVSADLPARLMVAPHVSLAALNVDPRGAMRNLMSLEAAGALASRGFREAVEYDPADAAAPPEPVAVHDSAHVATGLVALGNALLENIWQRRFHAEPRVRAAECLLREDLPRGPVVEPIPAPSFQANEEPAAVERVTTQPTAVVVGGPAFRALLTQNGHGELSHGEVRITRRAVSGEASGIRCYVRHLDAGRTWCTTTPGPEAHHVSFSPEGAEYTRCVRGVESRTSVAVMEQDHAELRRMVFTNHSRRCRTLELTTYVELELSDGLPAFAPVVTEWLPRQRTLLARRRLGEETVWCAQVLAANEPLAGPVSCETDRTRLLRGATSVERALQRGGPLDDGEGATGNPVLAMRSALTLVAGRSVTVTLTTLVARTREQVLALADRHAVVSGTERAMQLVKASTTMELQQLGVSRAEAIRLQRLAHRLLRNELGTTPTTDVTELLSAHGVDAQHPILLALLERSTGMRTLDAVLRAHRYWRARALPVNVVVLVGADGSDLFDAVVDTATGAGQSQLFEEPGGIHVRRLNTLTPGEVRGLRAAASVLVECHGQELDPATTSLTPERALSTASARVLPLARARRRVH